MFARSRAYRRKDGTRARTYECRSYRFSDGTCTAKPVDAEAIDRAVMEALADLLPDFEAGSARSRTATPPSAQRSLAGRPAERDRDRQAQAVTASRAPLSRPRRPGRPEGRPRARVRAGGPQATWRTPTRGCRPPATPSTDPAEAPRDRPARLRARLSDAIRGQVENAHAVEDVNRALVTNFEAFEVHQEWELHPDAEPIVQARSVLIEPVLRIEVAHRFWPEPLRCLGASGTAA